MTALPTAPRYALPEIVLALGEEPAFRPGERVRIGTRMPIGHYRVPLYPLGKAGEVVSVIEPAGLNSEEEDFSQRRRPPSLLPDCFPDA